MRSMLNLPPGAGDEAKNLARTLALSPTAANVLLARGFRAPAEGVRFLDPRLAHLTPPDGMRDRGAAIERLARAVRAKERVCVFGDYDADGVTAAALLTD